MVIANACLRGYFNWMYRSSPIVCSKISVKYLLLFKDIAQSPFDMCLYDVDCLILTEPHTNQIQGFD